MKSLLTCTSIILLIIWAIPTQSQDFFGANNTGLHTWGVNAKYDGKFWVGTHYNYRRFNFTGSPLDVNLTAQIKIERDGGCGYAGEFGINQVYANNSVPGFGLGARYAVRAEYHAANNFLIGLDGESAPPSKGQTNLSLQVGLLPGYYAADHAFAARIQTTPVKINFGCQDDSYEVTKISAKPSVRIFDDLQYGLHYDYTNTSNSNGRIHLTTDIEHIAYFKRKQGTLWGSYANFSDHIPIKADYSGVTDEETGESCTPEHLNLRARMSMSVRF